MEVKEGVLDRVFRLKERNTSVRTEVVAGLTTFVTMAYILAVNPMILGDAGMDKGAVFTATCLASLIATVCMAFLSNYPFALSAGMGLNAYFAYTVVLKMGYSWQMALAAVFVEGVIFILLSLTRVREAVFNAIPMSLKHAVSAGIGLFIAFIGMQNCKLVVDGSTLVEMYSFADNRADFSTVGITVVLAMVGVLITGILVVRKVKGNILWGILATWALGILCQLTGLYDPSVLGSVLPDFSGGIAVPSLMPTLGQMDFSALLTPDFAVVVFALLFVDVFDTMGGLIGIASKADMLDEQGRLPRLRGALLSDAIGTTAGAVLGTSTVTTFAESAAGVAEGGRTGLTALVTGGLFGVALFLSPLFLAVPSFATAPALIVVGFMMTASILKVDFDDLADAIPAFLCFLAIPFLYSISEGIALGVISYVVIHAVTGRENRRRISPAMYVLAVLFVLKYVLI
ncbi:putative permease [Pseudoflavonifractor capillosus ATCC 29799]|uniref:Putative permease n=1 Tax=Pseudoflavonifractor capillosus ATCC 29799 TaxID=411467 RepID=A6NW42_9FIRM|nr:NCS2 family permease [Pseudoflavonifractor capillosus]EDM99699.1 putative permease [Pseudoflavonifractor capillosus ATCC 29799]